MYRNMLLQRRFGAGYEQVAHRLTTLQRVGARGLPFFMLRIDRAGQSSKRYAGASASPLVSPMAATFAQDRLASPYVKVDRERAASLGLPAAAVGNTAGQDHVWVIENGQLARRAVKLGRRDERHRKSLGGKGQGLDGIKLFVAQVKPFARGDQHLHAWRRG